MSEPVTVSELSLKIGGQEEVRLLDVRELFEWEMGYIPGAIHIPLAELGERSGELENWRDQEVVVYCHHGVRSAHAVAWLSQLGFKNARNLTGGIDEWSRVIDPGLDRY